MEKANSYLKNKYGNIQAGWLTSNLGSLLSDEEYTLVNRGYRFIVVQPYLVSYRIIDHTIIIHQILHGRRDYLREPFEL